MLERLKHRLGRKRSELALDPVRFDPPRDAEVPVATLLVGSQAGKPLEAWIERTGEHARASVPLVASPYVDLLKRVREDPRRIDDDGFLRGTGYYRMARHCMEHTGKWFGAKQEPGLLERMRAFARMLPELAGSGGPEMASLGGEPMVGRTARGEPVRVYALRDSGCHEIVDGHHRAALAAISGLASLPATVLGEKWSYLQRLVLQGVQTRGRKELYQPVTAPEFDGTWKLVRRCADRFAMMERFLRERGIEGKGRSSLDLASSYGWFVKAFSELGFDAHGVERDAIAVRVGLAAYRLDPAAIEIASIERFLADPGRRYDVVLFLSILHHFVIGRESTRVLRRRGDGAARELFAQVDHACGRVLFFDTGEEHETWMADKLPGWSPDFIEGWLRRHGTFDEIVRLGVDRDVETFPGNYARTLFACVRS